MSLPYGLQTTHLPATETPPLRHDVAPANTAGIALDVRDIGKQFGPNIVLRDLSLTVRAGEFVAIVGRSGCGKSTLLRLLAGLDTPTTGVINVGGTPLRGLNTHSRMMFQEARLLPWKRVWENVRLGLRREEQARATNALRDVQLADRARDWPAILSGGQKQRVALARALASGPRLLLLDEPLGALDALTRLEMQTLIAGLWQSEGFTALLVTHDVEEAVALADRVVVMDAGRIVSETEINLPHPRPIETAEFGRLKGEILRQIVPTAP